MDELLRLSMNADTPMPPIEIESTILFLFAPAFSAIPALQPLKKHRLHQLWRDDAVHRAKNMAQLTRALTSVAGHPERRWLPPEIIAKVRQLSSDYEALCFDEGGGALPCRGILTDIMTHLIEIFGHSRRIWLSIDADEVFLTPEARRALILTCSEMIIKALKYAFPTDAGGTIDIVLSVGANDLTLIVEDNGCGMAELSSSEIGTSVLDQLASIQGASLTRTPGANGRGFRVSAAMPLRALGNEVVPPTMPCRELPGRSVC